MNTDYSTLLSQLIADRQLSTENIGRVMRLFSSGRDVIFYLQKDYTDAQLQEILIGLEEGNDVSFYDNIKLSPEQMRAIRLGVSKFSGNQSSMPPEEHESINGPLAEIESNSDSTSDDREGSSINETVSQTEEKRPGESPESETNENEPGGANVRILGKIIGFVFVAALFLLPRLIAQRNEKKAMEMVQNLKERGVVIKDGNIKYEPIPITVYSGDLSLTHVTGWKSETGDADGYGYHINLSYSSSYEAAIQVAAFNNLNRVSLSRAVSLSKNQVSSLFDGIKTTIDEVRDFDLNGIPAKVFDYRLSAAGEDKMNRRCITAVSGKYVILINEAFEDYNDKDFNDIFGSIERSIKIKSQN